MEPEPILPTPRETVSVTLGGTEASSAAMMHENPASPELTVGVHQASVSVADPAPQAVAASVVQSTTAPTGQSATDSPAIADDVEVIEKEWVDKAKKIVSATHDDPHMQEKEVSKLQADYLMKRYGKQIKLVD